MTLHGGPGTLRSSEHRLSDGGSLLIREARGSDAGELLDYLEAVSAESDYLSFGPGEFELTLEQERDYLEHCRTERNQVYLVGIVDGAIAATANVAGGHRPRFRHAGELGVSVRRKHWGRGIGSLLMKAVVDWARCGGVITKINLRVRVDNARAIGLYERLGFDREGILRRDLRIAGTYHDHLAMGLEL